MTDIVERLENWNTAYEEDADCDGSLYLAARDEILRLREALEEAFWTGRSASGKTSDISADLSALMEKYT